MPEDFLKDGAYFEAYQKIYQFHKKHINPTTNEDWSAIVKDLEQFITPLELSLMVAVTDELERVYKINLSA